jgi:hypothetical protein
MEYSIVVRGSISDPKHIELDEPVTELQGMVEVILRPVRDAAMLPAVVASPAWEEAFDAWVAGHDRSVPLPHPDALRREALYEDPL